jgi:hypothetical protein
MFERTAKKADAFFANAALPFISWGEFFTSWPGLSRPSALRRVKA